MPMDKVSSTLRGALIPVALTILASALAAVTAGAASTATEALMVVIYFVFYGAWLPLGLLALVGAIVDRTREKKWLGHSRQ